jgi:raffinose/stachyose/melibiose transport system permease protein
MKRLLRILAFLAPLLIVQIVVIFVPAAANVGYAFTNWNGFDTPVFNGLDNFRRLFADPIFWTALGNNVRWTMFFMTVPIALALLASSLIVRIPRGQMVFRTIFFIPFIISPVVNAEIWRFIFNPLSGIGAVLAKTFGWEWANFGLLANPKTVLWAIANVDNWHWWGFLVVLYISAMQSVPRDLYEAASLDGAGAWRKFRDVTLPGILPTLFYTMLLSLTASFLIFDYVWLLTEGGPGRASEVLGSYMYKQAFYLYEMGYSSAIALGMTLIAGFFSLLFVVIRRLGGDI